MAYVSAIFSSLLGGYLTLFGEDVQDYVGYIFVGIAVISLVLTVLRYSHLLGYNNSDGTIIKATVTKVFYYRGTKRVTFIYNVQGEDFKKVNVLNYSRATREIQKEQEIDIYVKKDNPKQALIREFYFDQEAA